METVREGWNFLVAINKIILDEIISDRIFGFITSSTCCTLSLFRTNTIVYVLCVSSVDYVCDYSD